MPPDGQVLPLHRPASEGFIDGRRSVRLPHVVDQVRRDGRGEEPADNGEPSLQLGVEAGSGQGRHKPCPSAAGDVAPAVRTQAESLAYSGVEGPFLIRM